MTDHQLSQVTFELLVGLSADELQTVFNATERRALSSGEQLCQTGDPGTSMFFIVAGEIQASRNVNGEEVQLAALQAGMSFGEIAVIADRPRSADLKATQDSEVLEIERDVLNALLEEHPGIAVKLWYNVATLLANRVARTTDLLADYVKINQRLVEDPEFLRFYSRL